jgi:hypothetical protein
MSSIEIELKIEKGASAWRTPAPITPPVEVTWSVIPRRKPPGVMFWTMSCGLPSSSWVTVKKGASR